MLRDDDFSRKASVDRYGRKIPKSRGREELKRFYRLEDGEEGLENDADLSRVHASASKAHDGSRRGLFANGRKYDPARDGGFTSSEDDSSAEEGEDEGDGEEDKAEGVTAVDDDAREHPDIQVEEATEVPMGEVSSRIAVVNMDWDNIRAADLMAVFSSFCPSSGRVERVTVYPSEFGKERLAREDIKGPASDLFARREKREPDGSTGHDSADEDEDEEAVEKTIRKSLLQEDKGEEVDHVKLRRYQLERLRYHYAVLEISSIETAKALYEATDGTEYLTTANFFDLRFVPDDVSFEDDRPHDQCDAIPDGYKPNTFVTDALQHSKVKLTWDAEDNVRKEVVRKAFSGSRRDIEDNDLKAYLASDRSDDEDELSAGVDKDVGRTAGGMETSKKERERKRLRAALGLDDGSRPNRSQKDVAVGGMEITFTSGLSGARKDDQEHDGDDQEETTIEKYKRKEKERKQRRKETTASARDVPDEGEARGDMGFDDPFFTSAPDDPDLVRPATSKRKDRQRRDEANGDKAIDPRKRAELELLMIDDDNNANAQGDQGDDAPRNVSHFNIEDVVRAEKEARRKKPRKKLSKKQQAALKHQQEGFVMDAQDTRFAALHDRPEYAIDPTNPRYRDTQAMRALLEEGRERRRRRRDEGSDDAGHDDDDPGTQTRKQKKHKSGDALSKRTKQLEPRDERTTLNGQTKLRKSQAAGDKSVDEIQRLVQRVKQKSGRST